jgi:cell division ATP-binding protein FtsE
VIEAAHLSKLYSRGVYALRDLSLSIDKGEFIFLTGPSGAGKSTLLRLLLREDVPSEGDLTVAGRDLATLGASQVQAYRRTIGFVFQDFRLISRMTVFQNVAFVMRVLGIPTSLQQRKTFQALKWVGLQHRQNAYPEELSGGEQQRVAIARALVSRPAVVFADEPTGNLDSKASDDVLALLRNAVDDFGQTVVMVTHDAHAASFADRLLVLADGRIVHDREAATAEEAHELMKSAS